MGRDKASLPFGPETLLERVVRLVRTVVDNVVLAAGAEQSVPAGLPVIRDTREGMGPLPPLLGAASSIDADYLFLVACDTPLLQPALIRLLLDRARGWDACVPVVHGVQMTTCAVYRTSAVRAAAGSLTSTSGTSLRAFLTGLRTHHLDEPTLREADPHLLTFTPCNTPDEYRHALTLAGLAVNDSSPPAV
jgi:molybdopterin-guanine dinucleotide biosynthesis protein A